ncbi:N-acetylglucosamine-1-phosphodiester alpha-N-acetylglucosaminidase isoform 2-T2 [Pholidichthys leucotaenia]
MAAEAVKCACLWLLMWLCVRLSDTKNTRGSMDDDLLLPYTHGHGPSHSIRHIRDCQPVIHGNITYETWPSSNHSGEPVAESRVFVSDVPESSKWVYGHMTVIHDPLRTVSVLEPGGPGGCEKNQTTSVVETAEAAECLYAQNGGFFNISTGSCLGNVVSNGRLVRDSVGVQNAQFGIRKDGSLVFGYLSQEDVLDQSNPFVQLISGVGWLLRNGQVYIHESMKAECDKTQATGSFKTFVDVVSARTAVGHDAEGRVILFHIDGQTGRRGMNLWEVADFLKKYGVINAINLDGGGSSTYVVNGSLASYPSDHCTSDSKWRCARNISTVLCIHKRRCQPANCSGQGDCVDGHCRCQKGWQGTACDTMECQFDCGPHGYCTANGCICDAGWRGMNCSQAGHCLAKQMFTTWKQEEDAHKEKPYLTEQTWLILATTLALLLSASLVVHLVRACQGSVKSHFPQRQDYSYVPLTNINRATSHPRDNSRKSEKGNFGLDDSNSEEEIWTPSHSGRL